MTKEESARAREIERRLRWDFKGDAFDDLHGACGRLMARCVQKASADSLSVVYPLMDFMCDEGIFTKEKAAKRLRKTFLRVFGRRFSDSRGVIFCFFQTLDMSIAESPRLVFCGTMHGKLKELGYISQPAAGQPATGRGGSENLDRQKSNGQNPARENFP